MIMERYFILMPVTFFGVTTQKNNEQESNFRTFQPERAEIIATATKGGNRANYADIFTLYAGFKAAPGRVVHAYG